MSSIRHVIVGTAGHIDHGKSTLVQALTGVDPDRLAEEKQRGMTIDLGFAPYRHRDGALVGIIDVPGHERFIRNMVAGATSVDIVLLVVAADDGVMPQTREHLQILNLVGARRGLVAMTKTDLVDTETLELALDDVSGLLAGSFLEQARVVPVSAVTGEGLDQLREELDQLITGLPSPQDSGPFRLPVQRVFSAKGHGTVVTGVAGSGRVFEGDVLEVVNSGRPVRVRAIQAYGEGRAEGRAGHSMALNVTGVGRNEVRRGDVVATPGVFRAHAQVLVAYQHVCGESPLHNHDPVRLHTGTAEVMGRAVVLDGVRAEGDDEHFVQVRLDSPVVVGPGDHFVLRHAASMVLLGGGVVLGAQDGRLRRFKERVLNEARRRKAACGDATTLALVSLDAAGRRGCSGQALALETACAPEEVSAIVGPLLESGQVTEVDGGVYVDAAALDGVGREALTVLDAEHHRQPLLEWLSVTHLRNGVDATEPVLQAALSREPDIETATGGRLRRRGHRVELDEDLLTARERVLEALLNGAAMPPIVDESVTGVSTARTRALLDMMLESGDVARVGGMLYHAGVLRDLRGRLVEHGRSRNGRIDIPELRDELGTTRKYLIPLLEHFDAEGLTVRHGDRRVLRHAGISP